MTHTRRDVSLNVVIRIDRTGNWLDWSTGHRSIPEALAVAETLVSHPAIAEIRFDRITKTIERMSLADLDEQPTPPQTSAYLTEAERIVEHCPDHGCVEPEWEVCHCEIADELRRLADVDRTPA